MHYNKESISFIIDNYIRHHNTKMNTYRHNSKIINKDCINCTGIINIYTSMYTQDDVRDIFYNIKCKLMSNNEFIILYNLTKTIIRNILPSDRYDIDVYSCNTKNRENNLILIDSIRFKNISILEGDVYYQDIGRKYGDYIFAFSSLYSI